MIWTVPSRTEQAMEATAEPPVQAKQYPPRDPNKPRRPRLNLPLAGVLVAQGMTMPEAAKVIGAANGESLRANLARKGVTVARARNGKSMQDGMNAVTATVTARVVNDAAEVLRGRLNGTLLTAADAIGRKRITPKSLASRGQGDAATLKQLAETWRTLNGNPDSVTISFGATSLSDTVPTKPAVDVQEVCPVSVPSKSEPA